MTNTPNGIAVFADLENPNSVEITQEGAQNALERITRDDYKCICPESLWAENAISQRVVITMCGDSYYGTRMGAVKEILAAALYGGEEFVQRLRETAKMYGVDEDEIRNQFADINHELRERNERTYKFFEDEEVVKFKVWKDIYEEMANVATAINAEFGKKSAEEVCRLAEFNILFSGKWNGSRGPGQPGRNLTFTNERIRDYGIKLQQLVQRMWNAGDIEDTPEPLTERQLFPVTYGDGQ